MNKINHEKENLKVTPPQARLLPLLQSIKAVYILWYGYYQTLPKLHRHSLGQRIDTLLVETMETISTAGFLPPSEKLPYIRIAIRKVDTIRLLLMILWETKSIDDKKYIALSAQIEDVGKRLGGWSGQIIKQNSSSK
jgi:hypothetical protein